MSFITTPFFRLKIFDISSAFISTLLQTDIRSDWIYRIKAPSTVSQSSLSLFRRESENSRGKKTLYSPYNGINWPRWFIFFIPVLYDEARRALDHSYEKYEAAVYTLHFYRFALLAFPPFIIEPSCIDEDEFNPLSMLSECSPGGWS